MQFALRHLHKVDRLVVVDMAPKTYPRLHGALLDAACHLDLKKFDTYRSIDTYLSGIIPNMAQRHLLLHNIDRDEMREFRWRINIGAICNGYASLCSTPFPKNVFPGPSLFIGGSKSDYIVPKDSKRIYTLFPRAELVCVQGAGHWVHTEAPETFNATVRQFLDNTT